MAESSAAYQGEAIGLTRENVDPMRSRITVVSTAIEVGGAVHLGQEPKTSRSRRTVPVARSIMSRIAEHLDQFVESSADSLVFTTAAGGPLYRGTFGRHVWRPSVVAAGLDGFTFHGLRHSFVSILGAAGCNVREVSEWAGHNSVAFTLTRYGGLFSGRIGRRGGPPGRPARLRSCVPCVSQTVRWPNAEAAPCG